MSDASWHHDSVDAGVSAWKGLTSVLGDGDFEPWASGRQRAATVGDALTKVWRHRAKIGITRVARLTDYDCIGIPVAGTVRPSVWDAQITATQGKGLTEAEALVSALFEAVERHAAAQPLVSIVATERELVKAGRDLLALYDLGVVLGDDVAIEWVEGRSLREGSRCLVPQSAVSFPYFAPVGVRRPLRPSTTGLAAGSTVAEALTQAVLEVIERDAVSRFLEGAEVSVLETSELGPSIEEDLLRRFAEEGVQVFVADLSMLTPVPVYFACGYSCDGPGPSCVTAGQGAHLSPRVAVRRALLELAQSRVVALQGSREDLVRHASNWHETPEDTRNAWEQYRSLCGRSSRLGLGPEPSHLRCAADALRDLLRRLNAYGYREVLFTNLTRTEIGIPVVRAIIPGCVDTFVDPERKRSLA